VTSRATSREGRKPCHFVMTLSLLALVWQAFGQRLRLLNRGMLRLSVRFFPRDPTPPLHKEESQRLLETKRRIGGSGICSTRLKEVTIWVIRMPSRSWPRTPRGQSTSWNIWGCPSVGTRRGESLSGPLADIPEIMEKPLSRGPAMRLTGQAE